MKEDQRWAIVGGGLLGATMAYFLAKAGRSVTLFESASQIGGLASAWQVGDVTWDRYYHVTLYSDSAVRSLLAELDLDRLMCWRQTKTGFYHNGRLLPFSNALDFARFPLLGPVEKARLASTILYASRLKDWPQLESISVEDWLTRLSGRSVFQKIWLPLLRAKLGEDYRSTSATFIWATIQRLYAARQSGMKQELFGYLPGGYAHMLEAYGIALRERGVEIRLNERVEEIRSQPGSGLRVQSQSGESHTFRRVIVTAPAPAAARLCPELSEAEAGLLAQVPYLGIICASVLLRRALSPFYVTNILDESIPFTGLIEMSALVDPSEFGRKHLVYIPRYLRPNHPDFERSDDSLREELITSLKRMHPSLRDEDLIAVRIAKSRYVFPRPTVERGRTDLPVDTSVAGLNFVNSAHIVNGTLNANETVLLAQREAQRIHALN